jgi:ketosteroid isomerase-like protein
MEQAYGRQCQCAGDRNGRVLDMDCCSVYTLREDKIAELHVLPFDAAVWDEFWS